MTHKSRRTLQWLLVLVAIAVFLIWMQSAGPPAEKPDPGQAAAQPAAPPPGDARVKKAQPAPPGIKAEVSAGAGGREDPAVVEAHKEIDRTHLRKLHAGIFAYRKKYGNYPEYLTQLVPEFVSAETLVSPHKKPGSVDAADFDHPDPGLSKPSYGYEFSNLEFRDGRTFAEIKEVQRAEWGDAVPLLRCFAYDQVINMAYGGEIYETALNWEWDPATMNVVEKLGWGPGLNVGETVRVKVTGPDGLPPASAQVWADGRNYSFDLPNRPYPTDANGYATIPLGADLDRTALVLRAEAPGMTSISQRYPMGSTPEAPALAVSAAEAVGGVALDESGQPLANAWVYLKTQEGQDSASTPLVVVKADEAGVWKAEVHPQDLKNLSAVVGLPGSMTGKSAASQPLDPAAARAGQAQVRPPFGGPVLR